jgi:hypothetical protein
MHSKQPNKLRARVIEWLVDGMAVGGGGLVKMQVEGGAEMEANGPATGNVTVLGPWPQRAALLPAMPFGPLKPL